MGLLDIVKHPKEWLVEKVADHFLTKAASGDYGAGVKKGYWFLHDYAPQIGIVVGAAVEVLKKLGESGSCPPCVQYATAIESACAFLLTLGIAVNLHASPSPAASDPAAVRATVETPAAR